jgi:hypothetical protein
MVTILRPPIGEGNHGLRSSVISEKFPAMSDSAPHEPTPFEKLQAFTRQILSVPKSEIDRRAAEAKKQKDYRKRGK